MNKHCLFVWVILGLCIFIAISACKPISDQSSNAKEAENKELIIGTYMPITTLVPWKTTSDGDGYILHQIYHTLVEINKQSDFTPGLAREWECSDDGLTWTFYLRDDVYWHRGNELFGDEKIQVTAEDVKFSFEYFLQPENGSVRYANLVESIDKIEVVDDLTVQFTTKDIDVLFEYLVFQNYIIPRKGIETDWDFHAHPVGSGAYKFVEHAIDSHVTLVKNDDFWRQPALDKITFKIITNTSIAAMALQNKEIDIALSISPTDIGAIVDKDYLVLTDSGAGLYRWAGFNCSMPLFQDPEIRRALAMAIDMDAAVDAIFANDAGVELAIRAYGPIPVERPGSAQERWKEVAPQYDPEGAMKILESKGWSKDQDGMYTKNGKRFSFTIQVGNNDANREKLAVIMASQLTKIGIDAKTKAIEWGTHVTDLIEGNVEIYIVGGYSHLDGPMCLMHTDLESHCPNAGYSNTQVDALLQKAWNTLDYGARSELLTQASTIFVSEAAHLGGYFEYSQVGYNKRVTDFDYASVYPALCSTERNVGISER